MAERSCSFVMPSGLSCRSAPLHDRPFCFLHDPEQADKAAEARRLGGARRRHESTLGVVYDLTSLDTAAGIRRLLEIAIADAVGLDSGLGRVRVLLAGIDVALKLFQTSNLGRRVDALEALARDRPTAAPVQPGDSGNLLDGSEP